MRSHQIFISLAVVLAAVGCEPNSSPKSDQKHERGAASQPETPQEGEPTAARSFENRSEIPGTDDNIDSPPPKVAKKSPRLDATLGADGLSTLVDAPDTDVETIRARFRGFSVFHERALGPGPQRETYYVRDGSEQLLQLKRTDGQLRQIWVQTPSVKGPKGVRIGQSYAEFESKLGALDCAVGANTDHDKIVCTTENGPDSVQVVFERSSVDPRDETPLAEQVVDSTIVALAWTK